MAVFNPISPSHNESWVIQTEDSTNQSKKRVRTESPNQWMGDYVFCDYSKPDIKPMSVNVKKRKKAWNEEKDLVLIKTWLIWKKSKEKPLHEFFPKIRHISSWNSIEFTIYCYHRIMYFDHMWPTIDEWTEPDTKLLLERVKYKSQSEELNWRKVAALKHFHSPEECRIKYYSLQVKDVSGDSPRLI
jgi:hypothetical protein